MNISLHPISDRIIHIYTYIILTYLITEVHPLINSKSKDKPATIGGKKSSGPGRPRNSDGKRIDRNRFGKWFCKKQQKIHSICFQSNTQFVFYIAIVLFHVYGILF